MSRAIASFGGVGFAPRAPGTAGSAAAVLVGALMMLGPVWLLPAGAAVATLGGWFAVGRAVPDRDADPGWVVIDEVAGQWIAMLGLGGVLSWPGLVVAFVLFRLLDIAKPGPIGWADRQGGAFGIMADDVLAGAGAGVAVWALRRYGWLP